MSVEREMGGFWGDLVLDSRSRVLDWGMNKLSRVLPNVRLTCDATEPKITRRLATCRDNQTLPYFEGTCGCDSHPVTDATCPSSDTRSIFSNSSVRLNCEHMAPGTTSGAADHRQPSRVRLIGQPERGALCNSNNHLRHKINRSSLQLIA